MNDAGLMIQKVEDNSLALSRGLACVLRRRLWINFVPPRLKLEIRPFLGKQLRNAN
jgi:hypothetical protein